MDPKIMFLDEPSAGLDPVVAAGIDELILQLRTTANMTVVVITHELESAFKIADSITVLDHGQILISDTKEAVRRSSNDRVQALLTRRVEHPDLDPEAYLQALTEREPRPRARM
jgi:phospholipid/cholesterol/gamma-HCH transport system ATP-binding protein